MSPNRWEQPAVFLRSGDPEQENEPTLQYPGLLGTRFTVVQPSRAAVGVEAGRSKRYQLVRSDSSMAVAPFLGATGYWSDKTQYLVTTTSPSDARARNRIAGIFQNTVTPGNFCCVQLEGPGQVKLIDGVTVANIVIGAYVVPSSTNAKADVVATGTAPTNTPYGMVGSPLTIDLGANTVVVDLNVPETT